MGSVKGEPVCFEICFYVEGQRVQQNQMDERGCVLTDLEVKYVTAVAGLDPDDLVLVAEI